MIREYHTRTNRKDQERTPPGFRYCPIKKKHSHGNGYADQYCDKDKCGFWNDDKGRCGLIR